MDYLFIVLFIVFFSKSVILTSSTDANRDLPFPYKEIETRQGKLLILMIDGWKWDYSKKLKLEGLSRMEENGIKAEYVTPIFPSNTYPNWYTIVTGLFPEHHGLIQNYMYDEEKNDFFLMGRSSNGSDVYWWSKVEPIWITAEKNSIKTALYRWDGCHVEIKGWKPSFCEKYTKIDGNFVKERQLFRHHLSDALKKLSKDEISLAMVYYESVDGIAHKYGPNAPETKKEIIEVDRILLELQNEIEKRNLQDQIVLMVLSDHGMASTDKDDVKLIKVDDFIDINDIQYVLDKGPFAMIQPMKGKIEKIHGELKRANIQGLKVYLKEELSEKYGLKGNKLVLPILLLAEEGYMIEKFSDISKQKASDSYNVGSHGYDPYQVKDMRTIFYALGPGLKNGYTIPPLQMVDHYNMMCFILGIYPHENNGSWSRVHEMLDEGLMYDESKIMIFGLLLGAVVAIWLYTSFKNTKKYE